MMATVTAPQAAEILSTSRVTVFRWVDEGLLPADRMTRRNIIAIDLDNLRRFAKENGYRFNEALAKELAE
jgi:predicted site-specific integrase-resolvase